MSAPQLGTFCGQDRHKWCKSIRCECECHGRSKASHAAGRASGPGGSAPPVPVSAGVELGGQRGRASAPPPETNDEAEEAIPALASLAPELPKERPPVPDATLDCPECGRTFKRSQERGLHRKRAHGVAGKTSSPKTPRVAGPPPELAASSLSGGLNGSRHFEELVVLPDGRILLKADDRLWVAREAEIS